MSGPLPDILVRFARNTDRVANRTELIELIEEAFAGQTIGHWLAALEAAGIPAGRIRTLDQVYECDQTRSRGLLIEVDHPTLGRVQLPGPPLRFDGSAGVRHRPPPTLGQHTDQVPRWLDNG